MNIKVLPSVIKVIVVSRSHGMGSLQTGKMALFARIIYRPFGSVRTFDVHSFHAV